MSKAETELNQLSKIDGLKMEVEKNPTDIINHLRLGWAYYGEDKSDEAADAFQAAIDRFPEDLEALYALGLALKKIGKGSEALKLFKRVIDLTEKLEDQIKGEMLRRLALGHANFIEKGDWDLSGEIWEHA
jgi:tetratricopeptide (TPR) repeat protein